MARYCVIGGGISGLSAAYELASSGHDVDVVERAGTAGGEVLSYCCKATDSCARCGVCVAHARLREAVRHERIRLLPGSRLLTATVTPAGVAVGITRALPAIDYRLCTGCDRCITACPAGCISRYSRAGLTQYRIDYGACLLHRGQPCAACVDACPAHAVVAGAAERDEALTARACLVATGHAPFAARSKPRYGYGRIAGVISGRDAEEILSSRISLGEDVKSVAFVQCVGSRDPGIGRPWCSAACCAYAVRLARLIKHRDPAVSVTLYYIDLQSFDKCFSAFRREVETLGVELVRGVPFRMDESGGGVRVSIQAPEGAPAIRRHDRVVLSVGMGPREDAPRTAALFGLSEEAGGFYRATAENVLVAGTCSRPQTIPECMGEAAAMAGRMMALAPAAPRTRAAGIRTREVSLDQAVLVLGGGEPARKAADRLTAAGHPVTLVGPSHGATLSGLDGRVGAFTARLVEASSGRTVSRSVSCGAVVVTDRVTAGGDTPVGDRFGSASIVALPDIERALASLPRLKRVRTVAIVLDLETEETRAGTEAALRVASRIQRAGAVEVHLFAHDARVAAPGLQELYDAVRDRGVVVVKYDGKLTMRGNGTSGASILCRDAGLGAEARYACDLVGVSPLGLRATTSRRRADRELADMLGVGTDPEGRIQENNVHLLPVLTSRTGVFVAGAARGQSWAPDALLEAEIAAEAAHALLAPGKLAMEPRHAVVDEEKCALCLTCVRVCPHKAMGWNREKKVAEADPVTCRACGICAGECPAKAISIPAEGEHG